MKTKEGLRIEWLEALRSGKYKQGKGALVDGGGGYCCLGVLCKIAGILNHHGMANFEEQYDDAVLPGSFAEHMGMGRSGAHMEYEEIGLANANDDGATFEEIADMIETGAFYED